MTDIDIRFHEANLALLIEREFPHTETGRAAQFCQTGEEYISLGLGVRGGTKEGDLELLKKSVFQAIVYGAETTSKTRDSFLYWRVKPELTFVPGEKAPWIRDVTGLIVTEDRPDEWHCYARYLVSNRPVHHTSPTPEEAEQLRARIAAFKPDMPADFMPDGLEIDTGADGYFLVNCHHAHKVDGRVRNIDLGFAWNPKPEIIGNWRTPPSGSLGPMLNSLREAVWQSMHLTDEEYAAIYPQGKAAA